MTEVVGKPLKVAVCMPAGDEVKTFFAYDLARLMTYSGTLGIDLQILIACGSLVMKQRESLADAVLEDGTATHILWLDTDMRFPKDALERLLKHNVPMVCASYTERNAPFRPVAFKSHEDWNERVWPEPEATGLVPIAGCGLGVTLVETAVLRKMPKPRFAVGFNRATGGFLGEDIFFFIEAAKAGFTLMLDQDLTKEVYHIGRFEFGADHAIRARAQREAQTAEEPRDGVTHAEGAETK